LVARVVVKGGALPRARSAPPITLFVDYRIDVRERRPIRTRRP
jgi:hypothetical protein